MGFLRGINFLLSLFPHPSPFHDRSFFCHHTKKEPKKKSPSANPYNHPPCGSRKMPSKDSGNFSITAPGQDRASPSPPVADGAMPLIEKRVMVRCPVVTAGPRIHRHTPFTPSLSPVFPSRPSTHPPHFLSPLLRF